MADAGCFDANEHVPGSNRWDRNFSLFEWLSDVDDLNGFHTVSFGGGW
jgi:hypothetical protein